MASTWGTSWGAAWGSAWGAISRVAAAITGAPRRFIHDARTRRSRTMDVCILAMGADLSGLSTKPDRTVILHTNATQTTKPI